MNQTAVLLIFTCVFLLSICCDVEDFDEPVLGPAEAEQIAAWVKRFLDDDYFKQEEDEGIEKRDKEINVEESMDSFYAAKREILKRMTNIFDGKLQFFPANIIMIQAMFRLMRPGGELSKEGFTHWGYIKRNGEARLILSRAFSTEKALLVALDKSTGLHLTALQVAVGQMDTSKPLVALTNYIISLENLAKLKNWLSERFTLAGDHVRHAYSNAHLRVVIEYSCCSKTNNPKLGPLFGTFKVRVG